MDYKIYKTDVDDLNPVAFNKGFSDYTADQPRTGADMNAADADGAHRTYHLPVPVGGTPSHYVPTTKQSAVYGTIQYLASNGGQSAISLVFDGVDDIDTVVAAWDAANVGNEATHDAIGVEVPAAGTVNLSNEGVYHLVKDATSVSAADVVDKTKQIEALYNTMNTEVYDEMETVFGTRDANSSNAYYETYKLMSATPASYSSQGLTASVASTSYAIGDALDTDLKIQGHADERIVDIEAYSVWRMNRIETFKTAKAAVLAS